MMKNGKSELKNNMATKTVKITKMEIESILEMALEMEIMINVRSKTEVDLKWERLLKNIDRFLKRNGYKRADPYT